MAWWGYLLAVVLLLGGIYGFVVLTRYVTGFLSSGTDRTGDSMYGNYADSLRKQRRYARRHGGQWQDNETRPNKLEGSEPALGRKAA